MKHIIASVAAVPRCMAPAARRAAFGLCLTLLLTACGSGSGKGSASGTKNDTGLATSTVGTSGAATTNPEAHSADESGAADTNAAKGDAASTAAASTTGSASTASAGTTGSASAGAAGNASSAATKTILFFGNSLTAGYGLSDPSQSFPGVIEHRIDSLHIPYKVVNAGNSGETSSGGNSRIDWVLRQPVDIFALELGANDGLRGLPLTETTKNLQSIIDKVKAKYPSCKILLLGMQVPPNLGQQYTDSFKAIWPALAQKNNVSLVPFILQGVGGVPSLNQGDGIHPTAQGAKIVANNVWAVLKGML
jgi:acyl-CoA thioesterase-1